MIDEGLLVARVQSQFNKDTPGAVGKIEMRYLRGAVKKVILHTKTLPWVEQARIKEFVEKELLPFEVTDDFAIRFVSHVEPPPGAEFAEERMRIMREEQVRLEKEEARAAKAEAKRIEREKADLEAIAKRGVAWKFEV